MKNVDGKTSATTTHQNISESFLWSGDDRKTNKQNWGVDETRYSHMSTQDFVGHKTPQHVGCVRFMGAETEAKAAERVRGRQTGLEPEAPGKLH